MSDSFKPTKIGLFGFTPELTQGTPNWNFTADGGSNSGTAITIATNGGATHNNNLANMTADFLNRCLVYFLSNTTTSALQGKVYEITDSAYSSNVVTLTVPTMAATPDAAETFIVFAPIQASDVSVSPGYENLPRNEFERQTLEMPFSNKGLQTVSGSFKFELFGLEQENGNGDTPRIDRLGQLLTAMGTRSSKAGILVASATGASPANSTTNVNIASGSLPSALAVGDWVLINNEAARVTATTDAGADTDYFTVSPALSAAPSASDEIFIGEIVTPDDTGHRSHTVLLARDTQLIECRGCVFSFGASGAFGANLEASAEFDGEAWDLQDTYTIDGQQSTKVAIPFVAGRAYFGTTALGLNAFEFSLGHGRQQLRDTAASQRQFITTRDATLKVVFRNTGATPKETWEANGTKDWLFVQVGNAAGACVVIAGYAQIQDPAEMTDTEGFQYWDAGFAFRDDQTDFDDPYKPLIIRF